MDRVLEFAKEGWKLAVIPHDELLKKEKIPVCSAELDDPSFCRIPASVPGNFELDLYRAGLIDDPYYADGIIKLQELEDRHLFYSTVFDRPETADEELFLRFEGIDTVADIYLNGKWIGSTENMLIAHEFKLDPDELFEHGNDLTVHITPARIASRNVELPPLSSAFHFNYSGIALRKAPYMLGWDIMPRAVSGGLWKPVKLIARKKLRINKIYLYTADADAEKGTARLRAFYDINIDGAHLDGLSLEIEGRCGDSTFRMNERKCWDRNGCLQGIFENLRFWWPRSMGEPALYDVTAKLFCGGELVDEYRFRTGIRTVALERTSCFRSEEDPGKFRFYVNGRPVFILGSNWVPLDAFPSRHIDYLERAMDLLCESGCNAVRCWGGNVYENDAFYDLCDERGILIWQDFSMGCAVYPNDERYCSLIREEAKAVIERLRCHPSLMLWAGDNECDYSFHGLPNFDPNKNKLTREILPEAVRIYDMTRPYLPSSPYIDEEAHATGLPTTEEHIWGPRDYFKGDYYKNTVCTFASEVGYHGCPEPESLAKFISPAELWPPFEENGEARREWLIHCTAPEPFPGCDFTYRIQLMTDQVKTLFGEVPDDIYRYAAASQISQAEAMKFFIERVRISKWRRTGLIWWNIIDGWPQISDAVVDWYGKKKLAFYYIKRSQEPVCMAFDEPSGGRLGLYLLNDTAERVSVDYTVKDLASGNDVCSGSASAEANSSVRAQCIPETDSAAFYLISWQYRGREYRNHFMTETKGTDLDLYLKYMKKAGFMPELPFLK